MNVPVPTVIAYCTEFDTPINAPWMLMDMLPGRRAYEIWFVPPSDEQACLHADLLSAETHGKRVTFLKSLAEQMAQLLPLQFHRIGIPEITTSAPSAGEDIDTHNPAQSVVTCADNNIKIGPSFHWNSPTDAFAVERRDPVDSTQEYINAGLRELKELGFDDYSVPLGSEDIYKDDQIRIQRGALIILKIIFASSVFNPSKDTEKFTIHHTDLDLQNILTDEKGVVTGILEWDGAFAGPRCIGLTAAPKFLVSDWFPEGPDQLPEESDESLERILYIGYMTEHYRNIYSGLNQDVHTMDTKYTANSTLYQAAFAVLYEGSHPLNLASKVLDRVPGILLHPLNFIMTLGRPGGWSVAEQYLREQIPKLLEIEGDFTPDWETMVEVHAAHPPFTNNPDTIEQILNETKKRANVANEVPTADFMPVIRHPSGGLLFGPGLDTGSSDRTDPAACETNIDG